MSGNMAPLPRMHVRVLSPTILFYLHSLQTPEISLIIYYKSLEF